MYPLGSCIPRKLLSNGIALVMGLHMPVYSKQRIGCLVACGSVRVRSDPMSLPELVE